MVCEVEVPEDRAEATCGGEDARVLEHRAVGIDAESARRGLVARGEKRCRVAQADAELAGQSHADAAALVNGLVAKRVHGGVAIDDEVAVFDADAAAEVGLSSHDDHVAVRHVHARIGLDANARHASVAGVDREVGVNHAHAAAIDGIDAGRIAGRAIVRGEDEHHGLIADGHIAATCVDAGDEGGLGDVCTHDANVEVTRPDDLDIGPLDADALQEADAVIRPHARKGVLALEVDRELRGIGVDGRGVSRRPHHLRVRDGNPRAGKVEVHRLGVRVIDGLDRAVFQHVVGVVAGNDHASHHDGVLLGSKGGRCKRGRKGKGEGKGAEDCATGRAKALHETSQRQSLRCAHCTCSFGRSGS